MKRKAIARIPYLGADKFEKKKSYRARAFHTEVEGEPILIVEVYQRPDKKIPVVRTILGKSDFKNHYPAGETWDRRKFVDNMSRTPVWERAMQPHGNTEISIQEEEENLIQEYTGKGNWRRWDKKVDDYEWDINKAAQQKREKKKKKEAEERELLMPELPKYFEQWCKDFLFRDGVVLFYKRHGNYADITCGQCGEERTVRTKKGESYEDNFVKMYPIPRNGNFGTCPACGKQGKFKSRASEYDVYGTTKKCYIGQKFKEKDAVIRYFEVERIVQKGAAVRYIITEVARNYFSDSKKVQKDYHLCDCNGKEGWYPRNVGGLSNIIQEAGRIYPGTYKELEGTVLQYSGIEEYQKGCKDAKLVKYMEAYIKNPVLEMLSKMGLYGLAEHLVDGYTIERLFPNLWSDTPHVMMGIDKGKMKRLIESKGSKRMLYILQMEQRLKKNWNQEQEEIIHQVKIDLSNLERVLKLIRIQRFLNQVETYSGVDMAAVATCTGANTRFQETAAMYMDYLIAKKSLGYDMTNDVYLRPKDLHRRHREVVEESRSKEEIMKEKIAEEKYSGIAERFKKLDRYYHYEDEKYSIRPARNASEIMAEGRILHHCVGSESQSYLRNHHEGKSTILFLRKKEEEDTPYITIEISGTLIMQWYGAYDKKPDESEVKKWLDQYVTRLKTKKQDNLIRIQVAG